MGYAQKLIVMITLLFSWTSSADWLGTVSTAGFFGKYSLGIAYQNEHHEGEFSLGSYSNAGRTELQSNLAYRYSPWIEPVLTDKIWRPIRVGVFGLFSWDEKTYFTNSPSYYPTPGYYDQTALRLGLEVGTSMTLPSRNLSVAYFIRVLDSGMIAFYNNTRKDLQYYISSSLSLRYHF